MPNIKSAIKRAKTSRAKRAHNASLKSEMRTAVKTLEAFIASNELDKAKEQFVVATKKLDKAATKGLIHKNAAARQKSRLAQKLNSVTTA
ncbi:MAG: 30S ribosomal protein S20 [Bacilli bacterium]